MRKPPKDALKWSKAELLHCTMLFNRGIPDGEIALLMSKKFPKRKWTTHTIRSKRGRLERAGKLKRGVAGSSTAKKGTKRKKMPNKKKIRRERWTEPARKRAWDLHKRGYSNKKVALMLKKEGLRDTSNGGAVGDQLSLLRKQGKQSPPKLLPPQKQKERPPKNSVTIVSKLGTMTFSDVSKEVLAEVVALCTKDGLGVG